jgi:putative membrane protein
MNRPLTLLIAFIAVEHVGFCLMETVFWLHPLVVSALHTTPAIAATSHVLAMNQGLYNLFLAAGVVWGLRETDPAWQKRLLQAFLGFIFVAGVVGGTTAVPTIYLTQALPAAVALLGLWRQEP